MFKMFLLIGMVLFNIGDSFAQENHWQKADKGIFERPLSSIALAPSGKLFASTEKAIYVSNDNANTWQRLTFLPKAKTRINDIACVDGDYLRLYIATTDGLYQIIDEANSADCIFKTSRKYRKDIRCIKTDPAGNGSLYIGTKAGLFVSNDSGKHWKAVAYFKNKGINDVALLHKNIFVAADDGIYKADVLSNNWIRTFAIATNETEDAENSENENNHNENESAENTITCLTTDINTKTLYAGTNNGMLISSDNGKTWQRLTDSGLMDKHIDDILILKPHIIAATKKGVFLWDKTETRWCSVSNGAISYHAEKLAFDRNNKYIYAATTNGLYRHVLASKKKQKPNKKNDYIDFIKKQMEAEPNVQQVQEAVIEYAEVSPDKIRWMREAAKNKAWMPKLTVDFDYDEDNYISIDRGGTNDPDVFINGPDDESWGWGVSLSWDLGELVWNDDQANIDVRSKLMVQLRDDILTEVTNLYFERRRLQLDIIDKKYSKNAIKAKLLRLQELTARIDALCGGFLSKYGGSYEEIS